MTAVDVVLGAAYALGVAAVVTALAEWGHRREQRKLPDGDPRMTLAEYARRQERRSR